MGVRRQTSSSQAPGRPLDARRWGQGRRRPGAVHRHLQPRAPTLRRSRVGSTRARSRRVGFSCGRRDEDGGRGTPLPCSPAQHRGDAPLLGIEEPKARNLQDFRADADERTRTSTWLPRHGPEPCASTNSATSAPWRQPTISHTRDLASGQARSLRPRRSRAPVPPYLEALLASRYPPLSSRGLGRRPLMAETRVRIPVAVLVKPSL